MIGKSLLVLTLYKAANWRTQRCRVTLEKTVRTSLNIDRTEKRPGKLLDNKNNKRDSKWPWELQRNEVNFYIHLFCTYRTDIGAYIDFLREVIGTTKANWGNSSRTSWKTVTNHQVLTALNGRFLKNLNAKLLISQQSTCTLNQVSVPG